MNIQYRGQPHILFKFIRNSFTDFYKTVNQLREIDEPAAMVGL
jgi:hypothetical protein